MKAAHSDHEGAQAMYSRALALFAETTGDDSRDTKEVWNSMAIVHNLQGRLPEAVTMGQRVIDWDERHLGPDHPDTLVSRYNLTYPLLLLGWGAEAARIDEDVAARQRRVLGQALAWRQAHLGPDDPPYPRRPPRARRRRRTLS